MRAKKCRLGLLLTLAWCAMAPAQARPAQTVVPAPAQVVWHDGQAQLTQSSTLFYADEAGQPEADFLAAQLRLSSGFPLPVKPLPENLDSLPGGALLFWLDPQLKETLGDEGYRLEVFPARIHLSAATPAGLFYAGQTLRQLLPPQAFATRAQPGVQWVLPCATWTDKPQSPWRGFMLDYARRFVSVEYTKHLLDEMAARKLNVFHMHLTDDDGWRIEIKKYPKLTEVGAWRGSQCKIPNLRRETFERYGGFFTQAQIKDIVAYAAARHIRVLPEIDLPGHALALCAAYPEARPGVLCDDRNDQGIGNNLLSPAREGNFAMVDDILAEVAQLFPFEYVHVGGDEVDHWFWANDPAIKELIRREHLRGTEDLQGYFTRRLQKILAKHGKKMVGWDDVLGAGLTPGATLMAWTGADAGRRAARAGFPVVTALWPGISTDNLYPHPGDEPPVPGWAGPITFQRNHIQDPLAGLLTPKEAKQIIGVHGGVWTEYVAPWKSQTGWLDLPTDAAALDFKIFPRLGALAQLGWAGGGGKQDAQWQAALGGELRRLQMAGVACRLPTPDVVARKGQLFVTRPFAGAQVRYTLDGSDPLHSPSAIVWDGAPVTASRSRFLARAFLGDVSGPLCCGARSQVAWRWDAQNAGSKWAKREIDLTGKLDAPGTWRLRFQKLDGKHTLEVREMALRVNGKEVDRQSAQELGQAAFRLDLAQKLAPHDKVSVCFDAKIAANGEAPDSTGYLLLDQAQGLEPEVEVVSEIPAKSPDYGASNLGDFDPYSYFWSGRGARKGEHVTVVFDGPEELSRIECATGIPGDLLRDRLADGILEISADGKNFRQVAVFTGGVAKADFTRQQVKAVRITVTADQVKSWLAVQDLILK